MGQMGDSRDSNEPEGGSSLVVKKREFLESFFKKGAEFTRELLRENDSLRRQIVQLESELEARGKPPPSQSTLDELLGKLHDLETERQRLLERLEAVDTTSERLADRHHEIERENSDLASLFVAQGQLYTSLQVREVVQVMIEILLNFVGAQRFALMLADREGALRVLATEGIDPETLPRIHPGAGGAIARAVDLGSMEVVDDAPAHRREPGAEEPTVAFSLTLDGRRVGAVAIWCFLPQKQALEDLDRRIFELLWTAGGRALEAARLASLARDGDPSSDAPLPRGTFEEYQALMA